MIITLTTLENQKNNINNNMTKLDLGECETLLRKEYNIANSEKLYMKKIDIAQEGMKIPKIEYDVYYKSSGTNLIKLNLTVCEKSKIPYKKELGTPFVEQIKKIFKGITILLMLKI